MSLGTYLKFVPLLMVIVLQNLSKKVRGAVVLEVAGKLAVSPHRKKRVIFFD
jgi:hypothetical protein